MTSSTPLLDAIKSPADLRKLKESDLPQVAAEVRAETINAVAVTVVILAPVLVSWN
jgi:1-deoxy-D-xylulose-5-phosphate synthase